MALSIYVLCYPDDSSHRVANDRTVIPRPATGTTTRKSSLPAANGVF